MLMRFDPFRELDRLSQAPWGNSRPVMPLDAYRRNGDFVVHFDLLGESLDPDKIAANYDQGVLTLHIPIAERAKPRKVEVSSGTPEAVEVTASTAP